MNRDLYFFIFLIFLVVLVGSINSIFNIPPSYGVPIGLLSGLFYGFYFDSIYISIMGE
jgi:hypothetical protein